MNGTQENTFPHSPTGPREERSYLPVLLSGLATTVLAMLGVYALAVNVKDFNIMGWYANYLIPAGAMIVGFVAASGYGLASWFSGIKITRRLLWTVLALQLFAYFGAQYIEFHNLHLIHRADGRQVGFLEYYDLVARSFAWKENDGSSGQPLGAWGYFFRGLEVLGFAGGGVIAPLILLKAPYCPECQRYMKTRQLGLIPASVPAKKVKKSDMAGKAAYEAEQQQSLDAGKQTVTAFQQFAGGNRPPEFRTKLEELQPGKKLAARLPIRFSLELIHCKRCFGGRLAAKMLTGQGKQLKRTDFASTELHPEFVRSIVQ